MRVGIFEGVDGDLFFYFRFGDCELVLVLVG